MYPLGPEQHPDGKLVDIVTGEVVHDDINVHDALQIAKQSRKWRNALYMSCLVTYHSIVNLRATAKKHSDITISVLNQWWSCHWKHQESTLSSGSLADSSNQQTSRSQPNWLWVGARWVYAYPMHCTYRHKGGTGWDIRNGQVCLRKPACKGANFKCSLIGCTVFCACGATSVCLNPQTKRSDDDDGDVQW